jgi:hypothetical protein
MTQLVGDTGDERRLGPDDYEVGAERVGEVEEPLAVLRANGVALAQLRDSGIPRRGMKLREARTQAQLPSERVLAAARADQEHPHGRAMVSSPRWASTFSRARPVPISETSTPSARSMYPT